MSDLDRDADQFEQEWQARSPIRILMSNGEGEGDPDDRTMVIHSDEPLTVTTLRATNSICICANAAGPNGETIDQAFMLTLSDDMARRLVDDLARVLRSK